MTGIVSREVASLSAEVVSRHAKPLAALTQSTLTTDLGGLAKQAKRAFESRRVAEFGVAATLLSRLSGLSMRDRAATLRRVDQYLSDAIATATF
ncbi:hypothetical protein H3146_05985 [Streptomyces sp. OF3]|uniref:Uncharacterized protein n=1 Tax=Streptomyces alkaliterrae TaxID=2213162 RepID=A0A7W3WIC9_9ACTN|nr:hypothetical protein [Streptomyces alkaliterrae]MBB1252917.1 hypothetical protein [Streptomyces alkaliterrae]